MLLDIGLGKSLLNMILKSQITKGIIDTQGYIAERNINNLRYADDTTLMAESEEALKNKKPPDESERGE